ncbi:hypothetical protein C5G87_08400 [Paenibacillus peoriae]|nr:hypothetical protein C5G87_08400 [Paenibacillus peoriae]
MNGYDTNICTGNLQELKPAAMVFLYSGKSPLSSELIIQRNWTMQNARSLVPLAQYSHSAVFNLFNGKRINLLVHEISTPRSIRKYYDLNIAEIEVFERLFSYKMLLY